MNKLTKCLRDEISTLTNRITTSEDYKNLATLKSLLSILEGSTTADVTTRTRKRRKVKTSSDGVLVHRRDYIENVYNATYKIVTRSPSMNMSLDALAHALKMEGISTRRLRPANCIIIYNRTHPKDQRLTLLPVKRTGQQRVRRYTGVASVNKVRLAA